MVDGQRDWTVQPPSLLCRLQSIQSVDPVELIFFWQQGRKPQSVGLCLRYRSLISGEPIGLLRVYQALDWQDDQVQQAYNQLRRITSITLGGYTKEKVEKYPPIRMRYFTFSARQIQALENGAVIPAMLFDKPNGEYPDIP